MGLLMAYVLNIALSQALAHRDCRHAALASTDGELTRSCGAAKKKLEDDVSFGASHMVWYYSPPDQKLWQRESKPLPRSRCRIR